MAAYAQTKTRLTPQEYLGIERQAEQKSEYLHGEMFAMAGATRKHNIITTNLVRELSLHLKGRPCEVYPNDMRVKISKTGLYTYPDVIVVCGEPQFEDESEDTLLNPLVLFEVLSSFTEAYDRGAKFGHYRRIDTLQEYVLVSQTKPFVEHYLRQPNGAFWTFSDAAELDAALELASLQCQLALAEIYAKVKFTEE